MDCLPLLFTAGESAAAWHLGRGLGYANYLFLTHDAEGCVVELNWFGHSAAGAGVFVIEGILEGV